MIFQNFLKGLLHWLLCNMKALTDGCTVKFKLSSNNILKMKQKARKTWAKKVFDNLTEDCFMQMQRALFCRCATRISKTVVDVKMGVSGQNECASSIREETTLLARLNIRPFFTAPPVLCSRTMPSISFSPLALNSGRRSDKKWIGPAATRVFKVDARRTSRRLFIAPRFTRHFMAHRARQNAKLFILASTAFATLQLLYLRCDELRRQLLYKLNKAKWARYISSPGNRWIDRERGRARSTRTWCTENMWKA